MSAPSDWTGPEALRAQVERLWDSGALLAAAVTGEVLFPLQLKLRHPSGSALGKHFEAVRAWIAALQEGARAGYVLAWEDVNSRQLGRNRVPCGATVPAEADALRWLRKAHEAARFRALANDTLARFPALRPWLARRPLRVLEHEAEWAQVLAVLGWFQAHPRPGVYLRQLEIPGVDTKFIERRAGLLGELLEQVLPPEAWSAEAPRSAFVARFGLRDKPERVRLRILDPALYVHGLTDVTVPVGELACLRLPVERVFVTENEVNGLAFPDVPRSLVLFGLGYSVDVLAQVPWLRDVRLCYWGDLDTHGFAMLDRLRAALPHAESLLMDRDTLLAHRELWAEEPEPHSGMLTRLTAPEAVLFEDLQQNRFGLRVRLEQERVRLSHLLAALGA